MKFDVPFTYISILLVYIFIIVLLYLPKTETMGFLSLFIWYFFAHVFLFSDLFKEDRRWQTVYLLIVSLLLFCSLFLMIYYFIKYINAGNVVQTSDAIYASDLMTGVYKIVFIVCEFVLLLLMCYVKFFDSLNRNPSLKLESFAKYRFLYLLFIGVFLCMYNFTDVITAFEVSLPFAALEFLIMLLLFSKPNGDNQTGGYYSADENNKLVAVKAYNLFNAKIGGPFISFFAWLFGPLYRNILAPVFNGVARRAMSNDFITRLINIVPFIFYCGTLGMSSYAMIIAVWFFKTYAQNVI